MRAFVREMKVPWPALSCVLLSHLQAEIVGTSCDHSFV